MTVSHETMVLEQVEAGGGSGRVLLRGEFRYADEVEMRCGPSPSKLCVEESGSMPPLLVSLAPHVNYTAGSEVHLWLNRGDWNAEAWGEWWERESPPERGATGSGAFLETSFCSLGKAEDETFSRIRSMFGVFCPSFSPSGADGRDLNMQFVAGKVLKHQNSLMQHTPDTMMCTDKARDWLNMLLTAEALESEMATILSGSTGTNQFSWFVQAPWVHLGLDYRLVADHAQVGKKMAAVTVRLSAMLEPRRIKSHQHLLSSLQGAGYEVSSRSITNNISAAGDAPPISVHRIVRDGRGSSLTAELHLSHDGTGSGGPDDVVRVQVVEPWDEQVFGPLWSKYQAREGNGTSAPFRLPDRPSFRLPQETHVDGSAVTGNAAVWTLSLFPGQSITAVLPVKKRHRHRDAHAADASRGVDVAPAIVTICRGRSRVGSDEGNERCWQVLTEAAIVTTPLPDFPMPFHVLTLVSTLMAFLLGSLVNTVFKGSKGKAAEEATKESS